MQLAGPGLAPAGTNWALAAADATAEVERCAPAGKAGLREQQRRATGREGAVEGVSSAKDGAPQAFLDGAPRVLPLEAEAEARQPGQQKRRTAAVCDSAHASIANGHVAAALAATDHQQQQQEHVSDPSRLDPRPRLRLHVVSAEDGYRPVLAAAASGGVCGGCGAVVQLRVGAGWGAGCGGVGGCGQGKPKAGAYWRLLP